MTLNFEPRSKPTALSQLVRLVLAETALKRSLPDDIVIVSRATAHWDSRGGTRAQIRRLREGWRRLRVAQVEGRVP